MLLCFSKYHEHRRQHEAFFVRIFFSSFLYRCLKICWFSICTSALHFFVTIFCTDNFNKVWSLEWVCVCRLRGSSTKLWKWPWSGIYMISKDIAALEMIHETTQTLFKFDFIKMFAFGGRHWQQNICVVVKRLKYPANNTFTEEAVDMHGICFCWVTWWMLWVFIVN